MDEKEKYSIISDILECMGEAVNLESDDSEKEDILIGLTKLCKKATYLPTNKPKRKWIKSCRQVRKDGGDFLTTELLLTNDARYNNYLGMSKTQFEYILNLVKQDITRANTQMRDAITPAEKLAITLRFLSTGESFRSIEHHTKVSCAAICTLVPEVCQSIIKNLHGLYLKFPSNPLEWETVAKQFEVMWQFPNCLGVLGKKHIEFRTPSNTISRGRNTIILMALVDANCNFIYAEIGGDDCKNESDAFLLSNLKQTFEYKKNIPQSSFVGNGRYLPYVIIGEDVFPMQNYLIKPYSNDIESKEKQVFNARLLHTRHVVKQSFDLLANRFRVLMSPINLKLDTVEKVTYACCILHNFILQNDYTNLNSHAHSTTNTKDSIASTTYEQYNDSAEAVRQQFTEYFNNEGKLDFM